MNTKTTKSPSSDQECVFQVRVRDVYAKNTVEEVDVPTQSEANVWVREWRSMYSKEDGYRVTCKCVSVAEALRS